MVDPGRCSTQTMRFRQLQVLTVGLLRALIEPHYRRVGDGLRLHLCQLPHGPLMSSQTTSYFDPADPAWSG